MEMLRGIAVIPGPAWWKQETPLILVHLGALGTLTQIKYGGKQ